MSAPELPKLRGNLTVSGLALFVTCLLVAGSAFKALRPEVGGLLIHPFLLPIAVVFPFMLVGRLPEFPVKTLAAMAVFVGMYSLSTLAAAGALSEIVKIITSCATIVCTSLMVRRRGDFVAATLGLNLAAAVLAIYGFRSHAAGPSSADFNPLDVGNKNSFSLYALPAILLGGYVILQMPETKKWIKGILAVCVLASVAAIFTSANRSGYLGCVVAGVMLLKERKLYGLIFVGLITGALAFLLIKFAATDVLERRMKQTFEVKNESDDLRRDILKSCFMIGLENPVAGVSPQGLQYEIGSRVAGMHAMAGIIESHNVVAHIWAGSGLICFAAFCWFGWTLWFWKPRQIVRYSPAEKHWIHARKLLRMMLFLWLVRGMFTRDILYNPGFCIGLGLAIGMCILELHTRRMALTLAARQAA